MIFFLSFFFFFWSSPSLFLSHHSNAGLSPLPCSETLAVVRQTAQSLFFSSLCPPPLFLFSFFFLWSILSSLHFRSSARACVGFRLISHSLSLSLLVSRSWVHNISCEGMLEPDHTNKEKRKGEITNRNCFAASLHLGLIHLGFPRVADDHDLLRKGHVFLDD